jgi:hypothetical protein
VYPNTIFPPHWPQAIPPPGYHNQKISNQLESEYSLVTRNIYDVLGTWDQQDEVNEVRGDEYNWPPGTPSQASPSKSPLRPTLPPPSWRPLTHHHLQKWVRIARSNTSILAMFNPSRHIFRDWTPQPFPVHECRIVISALGHPTTPAQCVPICKRLKRNGDASLYSHPSISCRNEMLLTCSCVDPRGALCPCIRTVHFCSSGV